MGATKWVLSKIKGIDKQRMNTTIDIISKNSGKSKLYIRLDIFKNFITRGIGYTDYFRGNYINLSKSEKDTFVTTKSFYKMLSYLNNNKYKVLLNDKLVFNRFFKPYLKRDYISLKESSIDEFKDFLKDKTVVFAKPPIGEGGHGILKVVIKDYPDKTKLYNDLKEKELYLVEDAIIQSKEVNEINPNVVASFRIVTLYKDGIVHVIANALRVNQDDTDVIGCTNDLYFSFNENGYIDSNVIDDYANIYDEHPLTKKKFKDVCIKDVKKAFDMCKEAALLVPKLRYIGWDVAFTDDGPLIVEGNEYPGYGLHQFYALKNSNTGILKVVKDILGDENMNI